MGGIVPSSTPSLATISRVIRASFCFSLWLQGVFLPKKEYMQWKEDHYEVVDCNSASLENQNKYEILGKYVHK